MEASSAWKAGSDKCGQIGNVLEIENRKHGPLALLGDSGPHAFRPGLLRKIPDHFADRPAMNGLAALAAGMRSL